MKAGPRVSELIVLTLSDVELFERGGRVIVREGKGDKYRKVPLSKEVRVALEMYLQKRTEDSSERLFLGQRGPVNVPGVQYLVGNMSIKHAYRT